MDIKEQLKYLSEEYESGEYVDISAYNYFELALDEIRRLEKGRLPGIAHVAEIERLDDELEKANDRIELLETQKETLVLELRDAMVQSGRMVLCGQS